jgi:hypothetical protein
MIFIHGHAVFGFVAELIFVAFVQIQALGLQGLHASTGSFLG